MRLSRSHEQRWLDLCAERNLSPARWQREGPNDRMAGLAAFLASVDWGDRRALFDLAEKLSPGASNRPSLRRWLDQRWIEPSRFMGRQDALCAHC